MPYELKRRLAAAAALPAWIMALPALADPPPPPLNSISAYACYSVVDPQSVEMRWRPQSSTATTKFTFRHGQIEIDEQPADKSACSGQINDEIVWGPVTLDGARRRAEAHLCLSPDQGGSVGWLKLHVRAEAENTESLKEAVDGLQALASCHVGRPGVAEFVFHGDKLTVYRHILGKRLP